MMNTKFVIKGIWDNQPVYYQKIDGIAFGKIPVVKLTASINDASLFQNIETAELEFENISDRNFKIYPVCPICGEEYDGHPATSRKDNKSKICPNCGIGEAFMALVKDKRKAKDLKESVITFIETQKKDY